MKPDLDSIYSELDLQPNCSLEDFQRAYRRRIADLHPDRPGGEPESRENQAVLRNLIWTYAMVTRFHRRYGRMPGGGRPSYLRSGEFRVFSGNDQSDSAPVEYSHGDGNPRSRATLTLVALFIALLVLLASWSWLTGGVSGAG